jgi:hypothetical protein
MGGGDPEKMRETMSQMMPDMMKGCMGSMGSEDMMESMHEMIPKMMENCLSSMSPEERDRMFSFCHNMLGDMKQRFHSEG